MRHLNINSIKNKFSMFSYMICGKINILLISGTNLFHFFRFPSSQFVIGGYSNKYRFYKNGKGSGTMLFIKDTLIPFRVNIICF